MLIATTYFAHAYSNNLFVESHDDTILKIIYNHRHVILKSCGYKLESPLSLQLFNNSEVEENQNTVGSEYRTLPQSQFKDPLQW